MGNYPVTCPVCREKQATYRDVFTAEGIWPKMPSKEFERFDPERYRIEKEQFRRPPFEKFLGRDCLKYLYLRQIDPGYNKSENSSVWVFYSCDDCICIGDSERKNKFYEHIPEGVTRFSK